MVLSHLQVEGLTPSKTPRLVRVRVPSGEPGLSPGDRVRVRATLAPPSPPVAPGGYDFQRDAFFDGIGAIGFALGRVEKLSPRDWAVLSDGPFCEE